MPTGRSRRSRQDGVGPGEVAGVACGPTGPHVEPALPRQGVPAPEKLRDAVAGDRHQFGGPSARPRDRRGGSVGRPVPGGRWGRTRQGRRHGRGSWQVGLRIRSRTGAEGGADGPGSGNGIDETPSAFRNDVAVRPVFRICPVSVPAVMGIGGGSEPLPGGAVAERRPCSGLFPRRGPPRGAMLFAPSRRLKEMTPILSRRLCPCVRRRAPPKARPGPCRRHAAPEGLPGAVEADRTAAPCRRVGWAGADPAGRCWSAAGGSVVVACTPGGDGVPLFMVSPQEEARMGLESWQRIRTERPASDKPPDAGRPQQGRQQHPRRGRPGTRGAGEMVVFEGDDANAFALPGGRIGVYEGIFRYMENDAQLATVIGHEIGHNQERHAAERLSTYRATALGPAGGQRRAGPGQYRLCQRESRRSWGWAHSTA